MFYLLISILFWRLGRKQNKLLFFINIFLLIYSFITSSLNSTIWNFPFKNFYNLLNSIYSILFTSQNIFIGIFLWTFVVFLSNKSPRVYLFLRKYQKIFNFFLYVLAFVFIYVKFINFTTVEVGFCELPDPAEYLKTVKKYENPSKFWPIFMNVVITLGICLSSCVCWSFLLSSIQIS